ncbi:MAG TPA: hypothetical protein VFT19_09605, partial [Solirubrobacterales bacterium]|nr:hypothetical protein [Solirubrobacterales bacterium]
LGCDAHLVTQVERDGLPLSVGRTRRTVPREVRGFLCIWWVVRWGRDDLGVAGIGAIPADSPGRSTGWAAQISLMS